MVDFGGLADKAKDLVADHADQIKTGVDKAGDFIGGKIGHEKVDGIEDKIGGFVDKIKAEQDAKPDEAPVAAAEPVVAPAPVVSPDPVVKP